MVVLNKISTRTGDAGETALGSGARVAKHSARVTSYGTVDELNATLGMARLHADGPLAEQLARIQNDLFDLGADLCTPDDGRKAEGALRIVDAQVERLEREIDAMNADLQPLSSFVLPGGSAAVRGELEADGVLHVDIGGTRGRGAVIRQGQMLHVFLDGRVHRLEIVDPLAAVSDLEAGGGRLTAPMPGKIIAVHVKAGAAVGRGTALLVMEAMKMEHTIAAPDDGTVTAVHFKVGEQVDEGTELIEFEAAEGA